MARKGLHMVLQEEVSRLKELGHSQREVSSRLGINRKTVQRYWQGPIKPYETPEPPWVSHLDWDYINGELQNGITRETLYSELRDHFELPNYKNFCKQVSKRLGPEIEITVKLPRLPGESLEVDYSGKGISILNPATGEIIKTELFVGVLSFSKKIFAEFTYSQQLEDFISSHNKMFRYYGGVPRYIVCDNLKSGVTKPCKLDPVINKTYHDLCKHYNLCVDPADSYKPRHKPNVEKAVDVIQRGFMQRVRHKTYTSLFGLNQDLKSYLDEKNNEIMVHLGVSRNTLFNKESSSLGALPPNPYELFYWKQSKVHGDCHIQLNYNYYSVPHKFVGRHVEVKHNKESVEIFFSGERVAIHQTLRSRGGFSTHEGHYPEKKVVELQLNYQRVNQEAQSIGPQTQALVSNIFNEHRFPLKNLRRVQGILSLKRRYDHESLEYAASQALIFRKSSYRYIDSCARNYSPPDKRLQMAPLRDQGLICLQGGGQHESI